MASLIELDHQGLLGPVSTIIKHYDSLKNDELAELLSILEVNFANMCGGVLPDKEHVLNSFNHRILTLVESLLATSFFKPMQKSVDPELRKMIEDVLVKSMITTFGLSEFEDNKNVMTFLTNLYPVFMTETQIRQHCQNQYDKHITEINEFRKEIGAGLYADTQRGKVVEADLDNMLMALDVAFRASNPAVLQYVGKYLTLFSMAEEPLTLKKEVTSLLDTVFRSKMYTKDEN